MALPDAINQHSRSQRVVRARQPIRERRAASAGFRGGRERGDRITRNMRDARKCGLHYRAGTAEVAAFEQTAGRNLRRLLAHHLAELRVRVEQWLNIKAGSQAVEVGLANRVV